MTFGIEIKKLKRTGYLPACLGAAALAALFPAVNMAARSETFTVMPGAPLDIVTDASWQVMAMLNVMLLICGACLMYHIEYADSGIQKMSSLPVRPGQIFFGKAAVTALVMAVSLVLETSALSLCADRWFPGFEPDIREIFIRAGFQWITLLPTGVLMLLIASLCRNMWVSLGTGIILVFTLSVLPTDNPAAAFLPFCSPFQTFSSASGQGRIPAFIAVCLTESLCFGIAELICQKLRRYFE